MFLVVDDSIFATIVSKYGAKKAAPKCAILTAPKAIAPMIIISVRDGFRFTFSENVDTFSFKSSIEDVSALSHLFIRSRLPIPINKIAIHTFATTMSTNTMLHI